MKNVASFIILGIVMTTILSCLDDPDCLALNNNLVGITFKTLATGESLSVDSLSITSEEALMIFAFNTAASKVILPLNYFKDSTEYTFVVADTTLRLVLGYKSQAQFVSSSCGDRFLLSNLYVIDHDFDSVRLVNTKPGLSTSASNLEIYWK